MRSRVIGDATGEPVDVLCFDPSRRYDDIRSELHEQGLLTGGMRLLNIFEHYREAGWGDAAGGGAPLEPLAGLQRVELEQSDGTPWQTSYLDPVSGAVVMNDFRRADGSVYLRAAPYRTLTAAELPRELTMVDPHGNIVGRFDGLTPFYHRWLKDLTVDDPQTFLFMDSRFLVPLVAPIEDPSIRLIYVMHNCHVPAPRRWDTPPLEGYRRALEKAGDVDAFVTLTDRQRSDVELRWGRRNNLAVVANPVERPCTPVPPVVRDPYRVVLVARLEDQKRVEHAIATLGLVLADIPLARLDIYGSGSRQDELQQFIDRRGLSEHVTLHGYDPDAAKALWSASVFLLTSQFEGYPLSVLESLSRGCPVVAYDVPYGLREQITDGVEGFLVDDEDMTAAADRVVRLLSSPELVQRMGAAGRVTAAQHEKDTFLTDWAAVLRQVVERSPFRTHLTSVQVRVDVDAAHPFRRWRGHQDLTVHGQLRISAHTQADAASIRVSLEAIGTVTGDVIQLPVTVQPLRSRADRSLVSDAGEVVVTLAFTAAVDAAEVFVAMPAAEFATLRVGVSWQNAHWEAPVSPAAGVAGATLDSEGRLTLRRPSKAR